MQLWLPALSLDCKRVGLIEDDQVSYKDIARGTGSSMLPLTQDSEGNKACFIDQGVYTKNRAFRLMLSSKAGKASILQPTSTPRILISDAISDTKC